jgi:hypothetical protein
MNALVISIGIWSHLIMRTALSQKHLPQRDYLGRVSFVAASFGLIYFWVSFAKWVLS